MPQQRWGWKTPNILPYPPAPNRPTLHPLPTFHQPPPKPPTLHLPYTYPTPTLHLPAAPPGLALTSPEPPTLHPPTKSLPTGLPYTKSPSPPVLRPPTGLPYTPHPAHLVCFGPKHHSCRRVPPPPDRPTLHLSFDLDITIRLGPHLPTGLPYTARRPDTGTPPLPARPLPNTASPYVVLPVRLAGRKSPAGSRWEI